MIDFIKIRIDNVDIINSLHARLIHENIQSFNENKSFVKFKESISISYDFQKVGTNGELGYCYLSLKPHYYYNRNKHNGNRFSAYDSINILCDMFQYIGVLRVDFNEMKVVGIEFGLNLILNKRVELLIDGITYTGKKDFLVPYPNFQYYKVSNTSVRKQIKAYAKGLQEAKGGNEPNYVVFGDEVDRNTFRFEIKSKKSEYIKLLNIETMNDLVKVSVYEKLFDELLKEWNNIFIYDKNISFEFKSIAEWISLMESEKGIAGKQKFARKKKQYQNKPNHIHAKIDKQIKAERWQILTAKTRFYKNTETQSYKGVEVGLLLF